MSTIEKEVKVSNDTGKKRVHIKRDKYGITLCVMMIRTSINNYFKVDENA